MDNNHFYPIPETLANYLLDNGYMDDELLAEGRPGCIYSLANPAVVIEGFKVSFIGYHNEIRVQATWYPKDTDGVVKGKLGICYAVSRDRWWGLERTGQWRRWLEDALLRMTVALFARCFNVFTSEGEDERLVLK